MAAFVSRNHNGDNKGSISAACFALNKKGAAHDDDDKMQEGKGVEPMVVSSSASSSQADFILVNSPYPSSLARRQGQEKRKEERHQTDEDGHGEEGEGSEEGSNGEAGCESMTLSSWPDGNMSVGMGLGSVDSSLDSLLLLASSSEFLHQGPMLSSIHKEGLGKDWDAWGEAADGSDMDQGDDEKDEDEGMTLLGEDASRW